MNRASSPSDCRRLTGKRIRDFVGAFPLLNRCGSEDPQFSAQAPELLNAVDVLLSIAAPKRACL